MRHVRRELHIGHVVDQDHLGISRPLSPTKTLRGPLPHPESRKTRDEHLKLCSKPSQTGPHKSMSWCHPPPIAPPAVCLQRVLSVASTWTGLKSTSTFATHKVRQRVPPSHARWTTCIRRSTPEFLAFNANESKWIHERFHEICLEK